MVVSEMTRFGFGKKEFEQLAAMMADCILRDRDITEDVARLRSGYTEMKYCFSGDAFDRVLGEFAGQIGL